MPNKIEPAIYSIISTIYFLASRLARNGIPHGGTVTGLSKRDVKRLSNFVVKIKIEIHRGSGDYRGKVENNPHKGIGAPPVEKHWSKRTAWGNVLFSYYATASVLERAKEEGTRPGARVRM